MENERLLWSMKEAGHALGLSPWTIRLWIEQGKIPAVRLGKRVMVEPAECARLIEEGRLRPRATRRKGQAPLGQSAPPSHEK